VQADSNKTKWNGNGHFYQRFDRAFTWSESKAYCESLSAHLATITSAGENTFIHSNLLPKNSTSYYYHIGGSDAVQEGTWKWITGEPWSYNNWYSGQPSNENDENYLVINDSLGSWFDTGNNWGVGSNVKGLICEWSYNNFVGSTVIPDLNGNGRHEIAALYVDYKTSKHTVQIKDSGTGKVISTLTFATDDHPPLGVVSVDDFSGNDIPEIAVLYVDPNFGVPKVMVKDAKNNSKTLKNFSVLGLGYIPKNITSAPDLNGNGSSEISVIGIDGATGKARSETRDSQGALIGKASY